MDAEDTAQTPAVKIQGRGGEVGCPEWPSNRAGSDPRGRRGAFPQEQCRFLRGGLAYRHREEKSVGWAIGAMIEMPIPAAYQLASAAHYWPGTPWRRRGGSAR